MQLSSDLNKQAQKEIFSRKLEKEVHLIRSNFQKHLGVYLDTKLNLSSRSYKKTAFYSARHSLLTII